MFLTPNTIGWFQIGTSDPVATERFYHELFGWTFVDDPTAEAPYRTTRTSAPPSGSAVGGGVADLSGQRPNYAVFCVVVDDVERMCGRAEAAGGAVVQPPVATKSGLVHAHLRDVAGNEFAVFSPPVVPT
jgi:uncharacterized protein